MRNESPREDVEVSPAMIEVGIRLMADEWGVVSRHAAEPMVSELFLAMWASRSQRKEKR